MTAVIAAVGTWFKTVTAWLFTHPVLAFGIAALAHIGTVWLKDQEWHGAKLVHDLLYGTALFAGSIALASLVASAASPKFPSTARWWEAFTTQPGPGEGGGLFF